MKIRLGARLRRVLLIPLGAVLASVLFSCLMPPRVLPKVVHFSKAPVLRVLLLKDVEQTDVTLEGAFKIIDASQPERPAVQGEAFGARKLSLTADGFAFGNLGVKLQNALLIPAEGQAVSLEGTAYRGRFLFVRRETGFDVLNLVDLESYLCGVLGAEMPLSWPDEALRAQAIAARSYAVYKLNFSKDRDYDVYADTRSQVYRGLAAETARARELVASTSGLLVTADGEIFCSYFHSTCGGETVPAAFIFGEEPSPELDGVRCGFCKDSKYFKPWSYRIDRQELAQKLAAAGKNIGPQIEAAWVEEPIRASNVHRVLKLQGTAGQTEFHPYVFRRTIFSKLKSPAYTVRLEGSEVVFEGVGFGHNVGLCQYGAAGLAREGHAAEDIIGHFYPGTRVTSAY